MAVGGVNSGASTRLQSVGIKKEFAAEPPQPATTPRAASLPQAMPPVKAVEVANETPEAHLQGVPDITELTEAALSSGVAQYRAPDARSLTSLLRRSSSHVLVAGISRKSLPAIGIKTNVDLTDGTAASQL
jgi:hypothetical protein